MRKELDELQLITSSLLSLPTLISPSWWGKATLLSMQILDSFWEKQVSKCQYDCLLLRFNRMNVCNSSLGFSFQTDNWIYFYFPQKSDCVCFWRLRGWQTPPFKFSTMLPPTRQIFLCSFASITKLYIKGNTQLSAYFISVSLVCGLPSSDNYNFP